jgi:hypothetical protein
MKLVFRRYVERELDRDAGWYEERQPGLREDFLEEVGATLSRIQGNRGSIRSWGNTGRIRLEIPPDSK